MALNNDSSEFRADGFEGIGNQFSNFSVVRETSHNVLSRAQRYGQWWLLKSLKADEADELVFQEMLRKEFELMIQLQHPHIVRAFSLEPVNGLGMCIVMEWIEGETLLEFLRKEHDISIKERLIDEVLDALAYLQQKGVAHRDLKPENIMLTHCGNCVKLIDFGLADSDHYAVLKQAGGTDGYMAPEQEYGGPTDIRNDIYSFGVILKDMRLGKRYDKVADRCMEPQKRRFQNIEELKTALKGAKEKHNPKSQYKWLWILGAVCLILAAIAGFSMYKWQRLAHPGPQDYEDYIPEGLTPDEEPTLKIVNPDFHGTNGYGWKTADNCRALFVNEGLISAGSFYITTFDFWQVVHGLEPGEYELSVHAFHRPDSGDWTKWHYEHAEDQENGHVYVTAELYADMASVRLLNWATECNSEPLPEDKIFFEEQVVDEVPNALRAAGYYFNHGHYKNKLRFTLTDKDSVRIGIRQSSMRENSLSWVAFDTFRLKRIEKQENAENVPQEGVQLRRKHRTVYGKEKLNED